MNNKTELYEFIMAQAHKLAVRYNNPQMYDDLCSEATLVGLELLNVGEENETIIKRAMRNRLTDFMNFGQLPVYVPPSGYSRKARTALKRGDSTENIELPLLQALMASGGVSSLDDNLTASVDDTAQAYEDADTMQHILLLAETTLSPRSYKILVDVFLNDMTQEEVATELGIAQQTLQETLDNSLAKIRKALDV